jgi:hypothetical protein
MSSAEDLFLASGNPSEAQLDVEMAGGEELVVEIGSRPDLGSAPADDGLPNPELVEDAPARVTYIDYLKSPVIGLLVGQGNEQALLTAHQALLVRSPWFAEACAKFSDNVSVGACSLLEWGGGVGWRWIDWKS